MEKSAFQEPEQPIDETIEETSLPAWRTPTIIRIDIKRTMLSGSGSAISDGSSGYCCM